MALPYSASCACKAVRLTIDAEPAGPYQCICAQCQHISGGGPATFVMVPQDKVTIDGEVSSFEEPTASGNRASRSFCPKCGTQLFSEPAKSAGLYAVKIGAIENAPWDQVKAIFWTSEKPAWYSIADGIKTYDTQ